MSAKKHQLLRAPVSKGESVPSSSQELARLKDRLLSVLLWETEDEQLRERYRWAAEDAAGLAFSTPWPSLFFPVLFAEKVAYVREWADRQAVILRRSGGRGGIPTRGG